MREFLLGLDKGILVVEISYQANARISTFQNVDPGSRPVDISDFVVSNARYIYFHVFMLAKI